MLKVLVAVIKRDFHCFFICMGKGFSHTEGVVMFNRIHIPIRWREISCEKCRKVFYKS
jgi:hypothetical protein